MGTRKTTLTILLVLTLVLVSFPTIKVDAQAKMIVVPDDYLTIQEAIDSASVGDIVFVKGGTYFNQSILVSKSISLVGEDPRTTIIQGKSDVYFPSIENVIFFDSDNVEISGLTVISANQVRGIFGSGNLAVIENNIIKSRNSIEIRFIGNHSLISNNDITESGTISCSGNYNNITENYITNSNNYGIDISGSFNTISGNSVTETQGLNINGNSNIINNNNFRNGTVGIDLASGFDNVVFENVVTGNWFMGISLYTTSNNFIYDNYLANNIGYEGQKNGYGISLSGTGYHAENNTFYRNTLINNSYNLRIEEPHFTNYWDNGSQGNYWDDYTGADANEDGIGDIPYIMNENNQDDFPLMEPTLIPEFPSWTILPIFLVTTLCALVIKKRLFHQRTKDN